MADLPYPTYSAVHPINAGLMSIAPLMTFRPMDIGGTPWETYAEATNRDGGSLFKVYLTKGYSYDISSSSFFNPTMMELYDQFGNVVAVGQDHLYDEKENISSFFAPYTGVYYINPAWNAGVYYTGTTLMVYEDQNPVRPNHSPTAAFSFNQIKWTEGATNKYVIAPTVFSDPDGDKLTFTARANSAALPSWMTFDPVTLTFSGTPPAGASDYAMQLIATDPGGLRATLDFVISTPAAPYVAPGSLVTVAAASILRTTSARDTNVAGLVTKAEAGTLTASAAIAQILTLADATTSVASMNYQFFTGKVPSSAGIDFLISPTGPNTTNLNSAYYAKFDTVNRYINFAVNLGKNGEAKDSFAASYGSLSLFDATKKAYAAIFGGTPTDAKVHSLIDTRVDYLASYGGDGATGIGTKAAMVGFLLAAAATENLGVIAKSNDAWLTDLADGTAPYGVNILDSVNGYYKADFIFGG